MSKLSFFPHPFLYSVELEATPENEKTGLYVLSAFPYRKEIGFPNLDSSEWERASRDILHALLLKLLRTIQPGGFSNGNVILCL
jgi:hypothetical protein